MKNARLLLLVGILAVGGTLVLNKTLAAPDAPAPPADMRVGVCDIMKLLTKSDHAARLTQDLENRTKGFQAEGKRRSKDIEDGKEMLKELKQGTDDYKAQYEKIREMMLDLEAWEIGQDVRLKRDQIGLTRAMYVEVLTAVAAVAKEKDLDVVLYRSRLGMGTNNVRDLIRNIEARKIVYHRKSVDITQAILDRLNADYKAAQK